MEAIRNYLETMFSHLPHTPEVVRAKNELWQMMEDKYNELKEEGKSENEAVGTVISEFGNLDELSDVLGIRDYIHPQPTYSGPEPDADSTDGTAYSAGTNTNGPQSGYQTYHTSSRLVTMEEIRGFLRDNTRYSFVMSLGIFFCIICVVAPILLDQTGLSVFSGIGLFLSIAVGVALIVFSRIQMDQWNFLEKERCSTDFSTTQYIKDQMDHYHGTYALLLTLGIALCILSVVPSILFSELNVKTYWIHRYDIGGALLFLLVGLGVLLIVCSSCIMGAYKKLLALNGTGTMGANFVPNQQKKDYQNPTVKSVMSVYWPTVTCLYLCWSFLSFDWHITWIIWPLAAILNALIDSIWKEK